MGSSGYSRASGGGRSRSPQVAARGRATAFRPVQPVGTSVDPPPSRCLDRPKLLLLGSMRRSAAVADCVCQPVQRKPLARTVVRCPSLAPADSPSRVNRLLSRGYPPTRWCHVWEPSTLPSGLRGLGDASRSIAAPVTRVPSRVAERSWIGISPKPRPSPASAATSWTFA